MTNQTPKHKCRVCGQEKLLYFSYSHPTFPGKNSDWDNYLCCQCDAISHFSKQGKTTDYTSEYRANRGKFNSIPPPIDPWSEVTFQRHLQLVNILERNQVTPEKILDLGGYNGFLSYGLTRHFETHVTCGL